MGFFKDLFYFTPEQIEEKYRKNIKNNSIKIVGTILNATKSKGSVSLDFKIKSNKRNKIK